MQTITPETSRKLAVATEDICDHVDRGMSPTEALLKVASRDNLTEGQIDLVATAYNAGTVTSQRKNGDTLAEKTAAVALADPISVKNTLFPKVAKAATAIEVHPMYSMPVVGVKKVASEAAPVRRYTDLADCMCGCGGKAGCVKVAQVKEESERRKLAREKLAGIQTLKHAALTCETAARVAIVGLADEVRFDRSEDRVSKLAYYRKYAGDQFGALGEMIIDNVAVDTLNTLEIVKYEELQNTRVKQAAALGYGLHPRIDRTVELFKKWAAEEIAFPYRVVQIRRDIQELVPSVVKQASMPALRLPGETDADIIDEPIRKMADFASSALGSLFGTSMGSGGHVPAAGGGGDAERDMLLQLTDPTHEIKLKAIHAQRMLHELAKTDDIVSSYTPQEVAGAFNEISQSAPHIINNQALLRANIRRVLQGNLSPFEAKEIMAVNNLVGLGSDKSISQFLGR